MHWFWRRRRRRKRRGERKREERRREKKFSPHIVSEILLVKEEEEEEEAKCIDKKGDGDKKAKSISWLGWLGHCCILSLRPILWLSPTILSLCVLHREHRMVALKGWHCDTDASLFSFSLSSGFFVFLLLLLFLFLVGPEWTKKWKKRIAIGWVISWKKKETKGKEYVW